MEATMETEPEPGVRDTQLSETVENSVRKIIRRARLLLDFSAEQVIDVPEGTIKTILEAERELDSGRLSTEGELKLRLAYREICNRLYPITLESIRDTHGRGDKADSKPKAPWHVGIYSILGILFLLCAILVEIYWVAGASITNDIEASLKTYDSLNQNILNLEYQDKTATSGSSSIITTDGKEMAIELEIDLSYSQMENLMSKIIADTESLHSWHQVWSTFAIGFTTPMESKNYELFDHASKARLDYASATLVLQATISYLLPLLFGLVGSFVWVIRRVSYEVSTHTFVAESWPRNVMRLALGPLAGMAVGLIIVPELSGSDSSALILKSLSPIALAFIAGYGVELVFAVLDRIVNAFTGHSAQDRVVSGQMTKEQNARGESNVPR
jgi:hypothetical protein